MAGKNRMVEWCDAGCSHSQQYFSVQGRQFRKIDRLQPFITTECFRSHCTHISLSFFVGCGVLADLKNRSPLQQISWHYLLMTTLLIEIHLDGHRLYKKVKILSSWTRTLQTRFTVGLYGLRLSWQPLNIFMPELKRR